MLPVLPILIMVITLGKRRAGTAVAVAAAAACSAVSLPAWAASDATRAGALEKYLELRRLGVPADAMTVTQQPIDHPRGGKAWAVVLRLNGANWLLFGDQKWPVPGPRRRSAPDQPLAILLDVPATQTSPFGWRHSPWNGKREFHDGIDLAAPEGVPVRAIEWGVVVHAGPAGTYGNLVDIQHADGLVTRYAHLSRVDVQTGDRVSPHTLLGRVGSTGRSTAPHLHFETRYDDRVEDPHAVLRSIANINMNAATPSTGKIPPSNTP